MLNFKAKIFVVAVFFHAAFSSHLWSQKKDTYGLLPSINLNYKLPKDWFTNYKIESRQELYNTDFAYKYLRTDMSFLLGTKIGIRSKIALGYQFIDDVKGNRHRYIQQINHVKKYSNFIFAHRLQTDQTFTPNNEEYRTRYRLSTEIPLNGQTLDANELFLKLSNEYLLASKSKTHELEIRGAAFLGYVFSRKTKFEFGVDNRMDSFTTQSIRNRFWLGLNLYQSL